MSIQSIVYQRAAIARERGVTVAGRHAAPAVRPAPPRREFLDSARGTTKMSSSPNPPRPPSCRIDEIDRCHRCRFIVRPHVVVMKASARAAIERSTSKRSARDGYPIGHRRDRCELRPGFGAIRGRPDSLQT
jgi:hypothetical protein